MIDIGKVNRRFRAHYYTHGKMEQCFDPPPYLLSGGIYPTKIRPEELPPWYVEYTYWNTRYVDTSRVTEVVYRPCRLHPHNHLLKDDSLYLAYDGRRVQLTDTGFPASLYGIEILSGWALIDGLISVREFSGLDITPQLDQLRKKVLLYNEEYAEPWPDPNIPYDPDAMITRAERHIKERIDAYETLHQGAHRP